MILFKSPSNVVLNSGHDASSGVLGKLEYPSVTINPMSILSGISFKSRTSSSAKEGNNFRYVELIDRWKQFSTLADPAAEPCFNLLATPVGGPQEMQSLVY